MSAPAKSLHFISPLSTLVKHQIEQKGLSLRNAVTLIKNKTGIIDADVMMGDYLNKELEKFDSTMARTDEIASRTIDIDSPKAEEVAKAVILLNQE